VTNEIAVSVVIPTLNEEAVIARCLESLAAQTLADDAFETIVVDNGSQDRTIAIARGFQGRLRLRLSSAGAFRFRLSAILARARQGGVFSPFWTPTASLQRTGWSRR